jgi:hypothetical protein
MNRFLLAVPFLVAAPLAALGAESATATLTASTSAAGSHYDAVLINTGTTTVGTFWFAWVPGKDFLPTSPLNITSPAGWQDIITHGSASDGYAIQWKATSAASDLAAGSSLSGFGFDSADTPTQLQGNSPFFPTFPVGTSFVYSGTPFSDAGFQFVAATVAAPEPASLGALGVGGLLLLRRRR